MQILQNYFGALRLQEISIPLRGMSRKPVSPEKEGTMTTIPDPHQAADPVAIRRALAILDAARDAVLAVLDAQGWPMTSRIAMQTDPAGQPLVMLSGLALHTAALRADPRAALLIDEPRAHDARGMALTRARLSLQVKAQVVPAGKDAELRQTWLDRDPKAAVYAGLPDFRFWRLQIRGGLLNAGFGKAFRLTADDLRR